MGVAKVISFWQMIKESQSLVKNLAGKQKQQQQPWQQHKQQQQQQQQQQKPFTKAVTHKNKKMLTFHIIYFLWWDSYLRR